MKKLLFLLLLPFVNFAQEKQEIYKVNTNGVKELVPTTVIEKVSPQETKIYNTNQNGIQDIQPKKIIIESEFKTEIYNVNESGIRDIMPEAIIEKRNEQDENR